MERKELGRGSSPDKSLGATGAPGASPCSRLASKHHHVLCRRIPAFFFVSPSSSHPLAACFDLSNRSFDCKTVEAAGKCMMDVKSRSQICHTVDRPFLYNDPFTHIHLSS